MWHSGCETPGCRCCVVSFPNWLWSVKVLKAPFNCKIIHKPHPPMPAMLCCLCVYIIVCAISLSLMGCVFRSDSRRLLLLLLRSDSDEIFCLSYQNLRCCQMCKCDLSPRKSLTQIPSRPPAAEYNPTTGWRRGLAANEMISPHWQRRQPASMEFREQQLHQQHETNQITLLIYLLIIIFICAEAD